VSSPSMTESNMNSTFWIVNYLSSVKTLARAVMLVSYIWEVGCLCVCTSVASYGQQRRQIRDEKTGSNACLGLCGFMHQSGGQGMAGDADAGVGHSSHAIFQTPSSSAAHAM